MPKHDYHILLEQDYEYQDPNMQPGEEAIIGGFLGRPFDTSMLTWYKDHIPLRLCE